MTSHPTFLPPTQEAKFNVQRTPLKREDRTTDRRKEDLIALPPVRGEQPFMFQCIFLRL